MSGRLFKLTGGPLPRGREHAPALAPPMCHGAKQPPGRVPAAAPSPLNECTPESQRLAPSEGRYPLPSRPVTARRAGTTTVTVVGAAAAGPRQSVPFLQRSRRWGSSLGLPTDGARVQDRLGEPRSCFLRGTQGHPPDPLKTPWIATGPDRARQRRRELSPVRRAW